MKPKLTPEVSKVILSYVRAGAFPHIAAQAAGVPAEVLGDWIAKGTRKAPREPFRSFVHELNTAKAQARVAAEVEAFKDDPRFWLRAGPGRERPDSPGWAAMVRPIHSDARTQTINLFASPDFLTFMATLRSTLAPFPEALAALSNAMAVADTPARALTAEPVQDAELVDNSNADQSRAGAGAGSKLPEG